MTGMISIRSAAFILILAAVLQACVPGRRLLTTAAGPAEVQGTYTLLLYGCHYPDQINNIALLVAENSRYPVEIYDLDTSYKTKKGVSSQQALTEADSFVRCGTHRIWRTQLLRIPDDSGGTIGYEVRPLYIPYEFGSPDVLLVSYSLQHGVVRVYVKVDPDVERALESSGDRDSSNSNR